MCQCTPNIRTPYCGRGDCVWPGAKPEGARVDAAATCHCPHVYTASGPQRSGWSNDCHIHRLPTQPTLVGEMVVSGVIPDAQIQGPDFAAMGRQLSADTSYPPTAAEI